MLRKTLATILTTCLTLSPLGCAPSDEYTVLEHPTPQNPWPESTRARLQGCLDDASANMPDAEHSAHFELVLTADGRSREVRIKGPRLQAPGLETCLTDAIRAMTVPSFVLEQAPPRVSRRNMPPMHHLIGTATGVDQASIEHILITLGPLALRAGAVGLVVVVGIVIIAAVATWVDSANDEQCQEEWDDARRKCRNLLTSQNPSRRLTGGYTDLEDCARGFVTEQCGGNPIDWGNDSGPRPGRRM